MTLPQLLPLPAAAQRLGLTENELRARVKAGTIAAGVLPDGEIVVNTETNGLPTDDINARLRAIRREDFEHLRGKAITATEAAEKYQVSRESILIWARKNYVMVLTPGYQMELDQADVAYCAAIHAIRKEIGVRTGAPLLDEIGLPYLLKHPSLSRYRRERRVQERI